MPSEKTTSISNSWDINAEEWIKVLKEQKIPSREITNPAIINHVLGFKLKNILDLGCGEGWLCRALSTKGIETFGVDGSERLILEASEKGKSSNYQCLSFEDIIIGTKINGAPFEGIIFNFCLYEKSMTERLLIKIDELLVNDGYIFIQTLHPFTFHKNGQTYKSEWVNDSWKGLPGNFKMPHRWYFRTLEDWMYLFQKTGYTMINLREPKSAEAELPSSIIFTLKKSR
ncbi:Methyltransferase domain-containing protein [Aquiflexum balticum DSM 16537]|uniref:Methyltransferase domain-containing protein n=1 Tax=Aquiflexum balticum DSM 16537 TaxID=758820 RepID=A0A1W2H7D9_9BACT|nr:methyltransferase domain-containing protein [Aquiflexum balticum]SMD44840.1 Methyltransferase domain-containing protein [Aquiflexum balticum DSM 16537]